MKELKNILREVISNIDDKDITRDKNDDFFRVFVKRGETREDDLLGEEVWECDLEIKVYRDINYWNDDANYHVKVNDDKLKNYKDGKWLYKKLQSKYKNKKESLKKEKISRIVKNLKNN